MNGIRGVAFDLDDTLLRDDLTISQEAVSVFHDLREGGVHIIPASGRTWPSMKFYVDQLACTELCIACNGAEIRETGIGRLLQEETFPMETALEIIGFGREHDLYTQIYEEGRFYYDRPCVWAEKYAANTRLTGIRVPDLSEMIREPRKKVLMIDTEETMNRLFPEALRRFGSRLSVTSSKQGYLEFNSLHATKGKALARAAEMLGIRTEEIFSFGDSLNDLSMREASGRFIAVANGRPEILRQCDDVCGANNEDGVTRYLEKHVLKREMMA